MPKREIKHIDLIQTSGSSRSISKGRRGHGSVISRGPSDVAGSKKSRERARSGR